MGPRYRFGKGPLIGAFERHVADREKFLELLDELRKRTYRDLASYEDEKSWTSFERRLNKRNSRHLENDVFGPGPKRLEGGELEQALRRGRERREIYCKGMRAALELAVGIAHDEEVPADATPAPIDVFWSCGNPANQCFVSWSDKPERRVTVMLLSNEPAMAWDGELVESVRSFPDAPRDAQGMFVIQAAAQGGTSFSRLKPSLGVAHRPG